MTVTAEEPYIGLDEPDAVDAAEWRGYLVRIVRRNRQYFSVDDEYNPFRVNLEIDAGLVTQSYFG